MKTFSTWLTAFMFAFFSTLVLIALQYPVGARFMPLVVGIPGMALCLLQLALDAAHASGGRLVLYRFRAAPKIGKPEVEAAEPEFGPHTVRGEAVMIGYFVVFISAVLLLGFYVSVPVMLVTFLRRQAEASWRMALSLGIGATLIMYLVFAVILHIRLHPGFLTSAAMKAAGF